MCRRAKPSGTRTQTGLPRSQSTAAARMLRSVSSPAASCGLSDLLISGEGSSRHYRLNSCRRLGLDDGFAALQTVSRVLVLAADPDEHLLQLEAHRAMRQ